MTTHSLNALSRWLSDSEDLYIIRVTLDTNLPKHTFVVRRAFSINVKYVRSLILLNAHHGVILQ